MTNQANQDGALQDLEDAPVVAKRLRLLLTMLGISTCPSDEELLLCAFSYLGTARRSLEDMFAATQASEQRIKELEEIIESQSLVICDKEKELGLMQLVIEHKNIDIYELQADNLRLREALEESKNVLEIAMTDRDGNKFVYLTFINHQKPH